MATFEAQVEGLTSLSIDGSSAPTQTELTQFLTDGAKEIINILPPNLLDWCSSQQTFTSVMPGSEAETMNTGKILRVYRNDGDFDRVCRRIRADEKGYSNDPDEMGYASITDPVFYTENNLLNALPQGGSCKYDEVQYPAVAYGDSAIAVFPDEAEYLVSLYGAIKSLQNVLGDKSSNSDITTAIDAANTELDKIVTNILVPVAPSINEISYTDATTGGTVTATAVSPITISSTTLTNLGVPPIYESPTETISGVVWATEYPSQASAITTALAKILASVENAEDEIEDGNKMVANIVLGVSEITESAVDTDTTSSEIKTAADAIATALSKFRADGSDPALFGDESTYTTASSAMTSVKTYVDRAISYIDGNFPDAAYDLAANLADVDAELTSEDIELASARIQQTQTTLNAVDTDLKIAQTYITEWNTMVQSLRSEYEGFANEIQARGAWTSAKAQVWNGYFASADAYAKAAQTYLASAQGYASEIQTRLSATPIKINEYQAKVQDSLNSFNRSNSEYQAKLQEAVQQAQLDSQKVLTQARLDADDAKQESAQATDVSKFNTAQAQALHLANEAKTLEALVANNNSKIQKYSNELQSYQAQVGKLVQSAQGYINEVQSRLQVDTAQYSWYEKQQAKLQADYDKGLQALS